MRRRTARVLRRLAHRISPATVTHQTITVKVDLDTRELHRALVRLGRLQAARR